MLVWQGRQVGGRIAAVLVALAAVSLACGRSSPTAPGAGISLPLVRESATMRYFHAQGDTIEFDRQEAYNAYALARLGVRPHQPVEYRKYFSRDAMGRYTGQYNANAFAEPSLWRIHSIWSWDNHEVVHIYTALIGRPSDFFNEGLAVSFQVDPAHGDFSVQFNGVQVHDACRGYLNADALPLPLSRYVTTNDFRAIPDSTLSYRAAGSFVLYLTEHFGLPAVLEFFRASQRDDSLEIIQTRMRAAFGVDLAQAESGWLARLRPVTSEGVLAEREQPGPTPSP